MNDLTEIEYEEPYLQEETKSIEKNSFKSPDPSNRMMKPISTIE